MVKEQNVKFLSRNFPQFNLLLEQEKISTFNHLEVVNSKSGLPTVQYIEANQKQYIHSAYHPEREAKQLIESYRKELELAEKYEHVLFYGCGFGYHIKAFQQEHPHLIYSIIEPELAVFQLFIEQNHFKDVLKKSRNLFISNQENQGQELEQFLASNQVLTKKTLIIAHPAYQRIWTKKYEQFLKISKKSLQDYSLNLYTTNKYSSRWLLNSLMNLPETLKTPNILDGSYRKYFEGLPLLIVSAGPSLKYEYENLKKIKEKGMAYIFAVGSANKALLKEGIVPDAICTYDPQEVNQYAFDELNRQTELSIPLIYGTSVGFETVERYRGPKLHMITNQDSITPYYLYPKNTSFDVIEDAPTIASVTLQLAAKLGSDPIVFVGQNLGYLDEEIYAEGIKSDEQTNRVKQNINLEKGKNVTLNVEGKEMKTSPSFLSMKQNLEYYISRYPGRKFINTTIGGAQIEGTSYLKLGSLIQNLFNKQVKKFIDYKHTIDYQSVNNNLKNIESSIAEYNKLVNKLERHMNEYRGTELKQQKKTERKLMQDLDKLLKLDAMFVYFRPMEILAFNQMLKKIGELKENHNLLEEALRETVLFIKKVETKLSGNAHYIEYVHQRILKLSDKESSYHSYHGTFLYSGGWNRIFASISKTTNQKTCYQTVEDGEGDISFILEGKELELHFLINNKSFIQLDVFIDNKKVLPKVITKKSHLYRNSIEYHLNITNLKEKKHNVTVKKRNKGFLLFQGVQTSGNLLHPDEVKNYQELEIGKRIRWNYSADYNEAGIFKESSTFNTPFIPPWSDVEPNGDFYFIMVDEKDGRRILISDRNIQKEISFNKVERGFSFDAINSKSALDENINIRPLTGGNSVNPNDNEWDKYIANTVYPSYPIKGDNELWNWKGIRTICISNISGEIIGRGRTTVADRNITVLDKNTIYRPGGLRVLLIL
ncbi:hypothetical protein BTS2_4003 [Bacillus sp. TS-2]|nr:hypothetical protein BTS2_4003 [Bacillus sp. TS-2]